MLLLPKLGQVFCLRTRLRIVLALREQLQGISLPKQRDGGHVGTEDAAKLQLSVRMKSRTHSVKTCLSARFLNAIDTDFELYIKKQGALGWRSGESARLQPMFSGFDSRTRRHMWVEFVVGSLPYSETFFSGYSGFPLSSKTNISKFQFDLDYSQALYHEPRLQRKLMDEHGDEVIRF